MSIRFRNVANPQCCLDPWRFYTYNFSLPFGFTVHVQLKGPSPQDLPDCDERNCMDDDY